MLIQYLKQDIKSHLSSRLYGRKGDKVKVLGRDNELVKVMAESGDMYYTKAEYLSIEFIPKDIQQPIKTKRK